jgi:hypothetical protein
MIQVSTEKNVSMCWLGYHVVSSRMGMSVCSELGHESGSMLTARIGRTRAALIWHWHLGSCLGWLCQRYCTDRDSNNTGSAATPQQYFNDKRKEIAVKSVDIQEFWFKHHTVSVLHVVTVSTLDCFIHQLITGKVAADLN